MSIKDEIKNNYKNKKIFICLIVICIASIFFYGRIRYSDIIRERIWEIQIKYNNVEIIKGNAQGFIKDKFQTAFFRYSIDEVNFIDEDKEYEGYIVSEENQLIEAVITCSNTFGKPQVMMRSDFQIQWHNIEQDYLDGTNYAHGINLENSKNLMPSQVIQEANDKEIFKILYEVPIEADIFSISYIERFEDGTENGEKGDTFWTYFKKI